MLIAYLIVSALLGLFMSYSCSSKGFTNLAIKMTFSAYTIWSVILLIGQLAPMVAASGMKLI